MGSAVAAVYRDGDSLHVCHAGDVRCYLYSSGALTRVTDDHSVVEHLVRSQLLTAENARFHPERHRLEQAVGIPLGFAPSVTFQPLQSDDRVLVCSDGLWGMLSDSEIAQILSSEGSMRQIATVLADRANAAGGHDNITVVLYRHSSGALLHHHLSKQRDT